MHKRFNMAVYLAVFVLLFDQVSKWWLVSILMQPPRIVPLNPFLNLVLVQNRGITFGLLSRFDPRITFYFLTITAGIILFLLGRWLWLTTSTLVSTALGFVIGGALGNVIDRLHYGVVVDFLDFHIGEHHWYSFNLADSAIVTGVGLLLLDSLGRKR